MFTLYPISTKRIMHTIWTDQRIDFTIYIKHTNSTHRAYYYHIYTYIFIYNKRTNWHLGSNHVTFGLIYKWVLLWNVLSNPIILSANDDTGFEIVWQHRKVKPFSNGDEQKVARCYLLRWPRLGDYQNARTSQPWHKHNNLLPIIVRFVIDPHKGLSVSLVCCEKNTLKMRPIAIDWNAF